MQAERYAKAIPVLNWMGFLVLPSRKYSKIPWPPLPGIVGRQRHTLPLHGGLQAPGREFTISAGCPLVEYMSTAFWTPTMAAPSVPQPPSACDKQGDVVLGMV